MLHFITDAPGLVLRQMAALTRLAYDDAGWGTPRWAESIVSIHEDDAASFLMGMDAAGYRVDGYRTPRPAIGDPTFAMAAAAIERNEGGSTPAPAYAR